MNLFSETDNTLFDSVIANSTHPLHILLPPKVEKHYFTRPRGHCYELSRNTGALDKNNFFYRLLYRDILSFNSADNIFIRLVVTAVCLFFIKVLQYSTGCSTRVPGLVNFGLYP